MTERVRIELLLAAAILVYANTLINGFTFDDVLYILNNHAVTAASLNELFRSTRVNNIFRPFTFGTFAVNWWLDSAQALGFHLVNVLLHAAVTLLLYFVLRSLLEPALSANTVAFVASLLFAVHPIHTEAVASIVGRAELLAAGFLLAAWLLHLRDHPISSLLCFALALFSKESAVVFLPLIVAGDYAQETFKPYTRYLSIAGITVAYVALLWKVQGGHFEKGAYSIVDNPLASLPALWRVLNALRIAWKYVGIQFYPATLSYDYSYNAIPLYANWRHTLPALLATVAVLILFVWLVWSKRSSWMLAIAIYLAAFAVTSNILLSTGTIMGERLAYLPSAGFCLLVALIWLPLHNRKPAAAWVLMVILLATFGTRAILRNRDWHDNLTLFSSGLRTSPGSARVHRNLGDAYASQGQLENASREFQLALRIFPAYSEALENYGLVESRLGHDQHAQRLLASALSLSPKGSPDYGFMEVNLANHLMKTGQTDEAFRLLSDEINIWPGYALAWSNRSVIHYRRGDLVAAKTDAETALRLDPGNQQAEAVLNEIGKGADGRAH